MTRTMKDRLRSHRSLMSCAHRDPGENPDCTDEGRIEGLSRLPVGELRELHRRFFGTTFKGRKKKALVDKLTDAWTTQGWWTQDVYTRQDMLEVSWAIYQRKYGEALGMLRVLAMPGREHAPGTFERNLAKFERFIRQGAPQWRVFTVGNAKLPFLSFSALPGQGHCPGAGQCLSFCYSFTSWRNPGAFFRQAQNTILVQEDFQAIEDALEARLATRRFRDLEAVDFRLYVDGDFNSMETLHNWMQLLWRHPRLKAYGYSKSLHFFRDYKGEFPPNYVLNLSSGGCHDDLFEELQQEPFVRGRFIALPTGGRASGHTRTKEERRTLQKLSREAKLGKVFVCPGKCGECVKLGGKPAHACGDKSVFAGMPIVIPVH